jgi:hypothetical protein
MLAFLCKIYALIHPLMAFCDVSNVAARDQGVQLAG